MIEKIIRRLKEFDDPVIITHIDTDGITSASIIYQILRKLGKEPELHTIKKLDSTEIEPYKDRELIFTDLGSGISEIIPKGSVVIDHHQPNNRNTDFYHLNAHLMGWDGSHEISSSGLCFLIAKELGQNELLPLAIVGAVGDLQDRRGFRGKNKEIAEFGVNNKLIERKKGLSFFGRETRPLHIFLEYGSDPYIPGLTGRKDACLELLNSCGISMQEGDWRTYHDLNREEKKRLITAVHLKAIQVGLEPWEIRTLVRNYYIIPQNPKHTELRDVTEFSTLLNATGRHNKPEVGLGVCVEPNKYYNDAKKLLEYHRTILREGINEIMEAGTEPFGENLRLFWSEKIQPTIIGVILGMAVGSGIVESDKVLVGAVPDEEQAKISLRMPYFLLRRGVNLGLAARKAAEKVSGIGGGHDIAAGAEVPIGKFKQFLQYFDLSISEQLK
jgi:RecJ-like exonuclease